MSITEPINIPSGINTGVASAKRATMLSLLGNPRGSYDQSCRPVTNPRLRALMVTGRVGPLYVTGLAPAVESLDAIVTSISHRFPDIYRGLGHAGMLCARNVRGSATAISNHSWGTAIDLTLNGVLDRYGDGKVQRGLAEIHEIFNFHGWFWGAGFGTEDGMHFECSDGLIRDWHAKGRFGPVQPAPDGLLSLGDRGPEVRELQELLNARAGAGLTVDGGYGPATHAAVMAFQAASGLTVDGVAGPRTLAALRMKQPAMI